MRCVFLSFFLFLVDKNIYLETKGKLICVLYSCMIEKKTTVYSPFHLYPYKSHNSVSLLIQTLHKCWNYYFCDDKNILICGLLLLWNTVPIESLLDLYMHFVNIPFIFIISNGHGLF